MHPSERDLWETYLPAFQALVQEGHVASVMGAYNRVNGESASGSHRLLTDILRNQWGFKGYVVSDCDSIDDIWKFHKIVPTPEEASRHRRPQRARGELRQDLRRARFDAVKQGLIAEAEIDVAVRRAFLTRFQLGMFDPDRASAAGHSIPYKVNQSPEHDALARKAAQESIVLLKNTGVLPLEQGHVENASP